MPLGFLIFKAGNPLDGDERDQAEKEGGLGGSGLRMERKRELGSLGYRDKMKTLWDHPGWLSPLCVSESRGVAVP